MDKYEIHKTIGEGSHGKVVKAQHRLTGEVVAIKIMKAKLYSWDDVLSMPEIRSLRKIDHPCVVKLKEVITSQSQIFLVYEFIELSLYRLYRRIRDRKAQFSEVQIRKIAMQLLQGVDATHRKGFIHRDIKLENVLICKDYSVKLSDFGIARETKSRHPCTEYVSTRWYRAPEMLLHSSAYSTPVDMWAVGCLIAELVLMRPLFAGDSEIDQLFKIFEVLGTPNSKECPDVLKLSGVSMIAFPKSIQKHLSSFFYGASSELVSLIEGLLKIDPLKRLTAQQALQHPFFSGALSKEKPGCIPVSLSTTKTEEMGKNQETKPTSKMLNRESSHKLIKDSRMREENKFQRGPEAKNKQKAHGPAFKLKTKTKVPLKHEISDGKAMDIEDLDSVLPEIPSGLSMSQVYRKPSALGNTIKNDSAVIFRPGGVPTRELETKLPSIWANSVKGSNNGPGPLTKSAEFQGGPKKFGKLLGNLKTCSHQPSE